MRRTVFAFSDEEAELVREMLEQLVRALRMVPGGGKMEEDYWSYIYHRVHGVAPSGWSNLPMRDFCYGGLGVEIKLLRRNSPLADQGRTLMHPAATRTIQFDPRRDAETCKTQVLEQFGRQIAEFRQRVGATAEDGSADIRWGIFLWSPRLDEFLYFEEAMEEPDPDEFYAEFREGRHRGQPTRNLHIFEKAAGIKRYSITMPEKGAKVQPYFDIPEVGKGAYAFRVPDDERQGVWLKRETVDALRQAAVGGDLDTLIMRALDPR